MPKAIAPKAPWVEVWLSPQTMVMPGWVRPCSGPITWTMPWPLLPMGCRVMPNSAAFWRITSTWRRGDGVGDELDVAAGRLGRGGHVVVFGGDGEVGPANLAVGQAEPVERLRRGDFVDEVEVDEEKVGVASFAGADQMVFPDLLGQGLGCRHC